MGKHSAEQLQRIGARAANATKEKVCTEKGLYGRAEERRARLGEVSAFLDLLQDQVDLAPRGGRGAEVVMVRLSGADVQALGACREHLVESMRELEWDSEGVRRLARAMARKV